ncbi:hypothetical protein [Mycobacterium hubeiense]|uniref:hypothetical protein n=1 Tax=Mycobacterium hubeiense TaxID=1867256 RepID=UPI000C7E88BC|nr:hypothetical protein [Mycobacterium sp. QGD 101]
MSEHIWHRHEWAFDSCGCPDPTADGLGPQCDTIIELAATADNLSTDQAQRLSENRDNAFWDSPTWFEATMAAKAAIHAADHASTTARRSGRAIETLFGLHRPPRRPVRLHPYRPLALDVGLALAARDLIDETFTRQYDGWPGPWQQAITFTQAHYDFLTGPWRHVVGVIHTDDQPAEPGTD